MALRGVCFVPGLVSDCFYSFQIVFVWFETGSDWFLGVLAPPRTNLNRFRTPKINLKLPKTKLKPNPVQNRPPVKPSLCLTTQGSGHHRKKKCRTVAWPGFGPAAPQTPRSIFGVLGGRSPSSWGGGPCLPRTPVSSTWGSAWVPEGSLVGFFGVRF